ncbi:MAG: DUF4347 domain-containing protein [Cyanobacteria bacterium P01_E01_bin.35]
MTICIPNPVTNLVNYGSVGDLGDRQTVRSLIIIDSQVDNWDILIAGVEPHSRVILLDPRQDSILQINELIKQFPGVASLHLVSHGTPGSISLGSTNFNSKSLGKYQETLRSWSNYLKNTTLYIYGCQVAKGKQAEDFLYQLHDLTQAKIAASTAMMGNGKDINNWQFDYLIGDINQESAFTPETLARYSGTFDPVVSFSTTPDTLIETEGTLFSFNFELSEAPPPGGVIVAVDGNVPESLNQLDLFAIEVEGGDSVEGDFDFSGFNFNITEQTASIIVPVFLDDDSSDAIFSDDDPLTPDDFVVTYSLQSGNGYQIDPEQNSGTVSFFDTAEDVVIEPEPTPEPFPEPETDEGEVLVYRFFEPTVGSHLYTSSEDERDVIQENLSNYNFEGASYIALDPLTGEEQTQESNLTNVYRFFNPTTGAHLYTASEDERDFIQDNLDDFDFDGVQFAVYNTDIGVETIPVHRFFAPDLGVHFYTPSEAERANVEANLPNYEYEGIAYYAIDLDA